MIILEKALTRAMKLEELLTSKKFLIACPIPTKNVDLAIEQAEKAIGEGADLVEFRVDYLITLDSSECIDAILRIVKEFNHPKIITMREKAEGGFKEISPLVKLKILNMLERKTSTYVDIELEFYKKYGKNIKTTEYDGLIISKHYFYERPTERELIVTISKASEIPGVDIVKIASIVTNENDLLELLKVLTLRKDTKPYIAIFPMSNVQIYRLIPPLLGSKLVFCSLVELTAPGQIPLEMCIVFRDLIEKL